MNSGIALKDLAPPHLPLDLSSSSQEETNEAVDFDAYTPIPEQSITIELEYGTTVFPLEGEKKLRAVKPLKLAYIDDEDTIEIVGWNLAITLDDATDLPRMIARRFLELYSAAVTETLSEQDEACFANACNEIDYRDFCANRDLPRYMQAFLIRKDPPLIRYLSSRNQKPVRPLAEKLRLLEPGDYFGAYFTLDRTGQIIDIDNIVLLKPPDNLSTGQGPAETLSIPDGFPDALYEQLHKLEQPGGRKDSSET